MLYMFHQKNFFILLPGLLPFLMETLEVNMVKSLQYKEGTELEPFGDSQKSG